MTTLPEAFKTTERELGQVVRAGIAHARPGLSTIGIEITNNVKRLLQHKGSGIIYRRGGVEHQASAPGEPPATDRGRLVQSYTWVYGEDIAGPYVEIGTNVEYAPPLEFGNSRGLEPRPHFRPAVEQARPTITRVLARAMAQGEQQASARLPKQITVDTVVPT